MQKKMTKGLLGEDGLLTAKDIKEKSDFLEGEETHNKLQKIKDELKELKLKAKDRGQDFRHTAVAVFLGFTYLIFASTSSMVFRAFLCKQYGDDETFYLVADKTVDCASPEYHAWKFYATIMIGVYPLGIPTMYMWLLWRKRKILLDEVSFGVACLRSD